MNVIDDIKDKMGGNSSTGSDLDSSLDGVGEDLGNSENNGLNSQGEDLASNTAGIDRNSPGGNQSKTGNSGRSQQKRRQRQGNSQQNRVRGNGRSSNTQGVGQGRSTQTGRGSQENSSAGGRMPNPRSGRPQAGDSSPQISDSTRKKMENAGMDPGNPESVSSNRSDMEELKAQNEQIIDLLKRINSKL
ncbi:MAG: hypothetical protein ABEJ95_07040 [Candidatus Nanohalobium sp.]